jgi:hypothetical protein
MRVPGPARPSAAAIGLGVATEPSPPKLDTVGQQVMLSTGGLGGAAASCTLARLLERRRAGAVATDRASASFIGAAEAGRFHPHVSAILSKLKAPGVRPRIARALPSRRATCSPPPSPSAADPRIRHRACRAVLREARGSIRAPDPRLTGLADVRLVLVDDGSRDGTRTLLARSASRGRSGSS